MVKYFFALQICHINSQTLYDKRMNFVNNNKMGMKFLKFSFERSVSDTVVAVEGRREEYLTVIL